MEIPRRLARHQGALTGLYAMPVSALARRIAEPSLLGRGLRAWDSGHGALLAQRLLAEPGALALPAGMPRGPVARVLARTLSSLRLAGVPPSALEAIGDPGEPRADRERRAALARIHRGYEAAVVDRFADPLAILLAAREQLPHTDWLRGADVVVLDEPELEPLEQEFLDALAKHVTVRFVTREAPPAMRPGSLGAWAQSRGYSRVDLGETFLSPLDAPLPDGSLARLRRRLFEPPAEPADLDDGLELVTAPGEAAEVRSVVRRLLREAGRGVRFEDMAILLGRPTVYFPLLADLMDRLGLPFRLHPSLPLATSRSARALRLLLRCRGLPRAAVMEFLTFMPVPAAVLPDGAAPRSARWDAISRKAGIVSGLGRWRSALTTFAQVERQEAALTEDALRRERREEWANDALVLLGLVERLDRDLGELHGDAFWPTWAARLRRISETWISPGRRPEDVLAHGALGECIDALGGLTFLGGEAPWAEVEDVVEARLEWERTPAPAPEEGGVHIGSMEALAGLSFRVVMIPGLVEGGYPGILRPEPLLSDTERERLLAPGPLASPRPAEQPRQLGLFDPPDAPPASTFMTTGYRLPTTQDRVAEARRRFQKAVSQATERVVLSYPRADPATGRERLPSLFFVAAMQAALGRPVGAADLERDVAEDELDALPLEDAVDRSERDRARVRRGGGEAVRAIAAGSGSFRRARTAARARWSNRLTPYDGLVVLPPELAQRLDPTRDPRPTSASRLATFSLCGFRYLLQHVLRLEAYLEPEERMALDPLERGSLFHEVAELFLRERRERSELPLRETPALRARLRELATERLAAFVAASPPRFTFLWDQEQARFLEGMDRWLTREIAMASRSMPAYFEVSFGLPRRMATAEPHSPDPLVIDLGDGRQLKVAGKIDRIDRAPQGGWILRDYKTGRAPKDEPGVFRGGRQLQVPFYILAAEQLLPQEPVIEAFLDYVDGGRAVSLDPRAVRGEPFRTLLRTLVDQVAGGAFVQEPSACDWCDFTAVCGPKPLLEIRRRYKWPDRRVQDYARLRDMG